MSAPIRVVDAEVLAEGAELYEGTVEEFVLRVIGRATECEGSDRWFRSTITELVDGYRAISDAPEGEA